MEYRTLGSSGFEVSVLSFGAWQLGDPAYWGEFDARAAAETVAAALDAGVNLFDTAEWYGAGQSEEVLGKALEGRRDRALVASKVSPQNCTRQGVRESCEASLRRLGMDTIDLYQVHWPNREVSFEETYLALLDLKQDGKIRAIGVSNFGPQDLRAWTAAGECVSDQIGYNALFRAAEFEIIPTCIERGIGVLAYMPLMQGILTGRWKTVDDIPQLRRRTRHFASTREGAMHTESGAEDLLMRTLAALEAVAVKLERPMADVALAWLVAQPGVTSVITGIHAIEQLSRNVSGVELSLERSVLSEIESATNPLKDKLGRNPDMWKCGLDARIR
ncbi:MAG: aldo/keto reductase [FCB group bacterium]|nr:aldo/keto reductase [FCB group bacterium]